jgi:hypothetical protein
VSETGRQVRLIDGDRVKIHGVIADDVIRATKLELEEFPEIEVRGTASNLPAGGVTLPVPSGITIHFTVTLVLTEHAKVEGRHTLANDDTVRIDAVLKDNQLARRREEQTGYAGPPHNEPVTTIAARIP